MRRILAKFLVFYLKVCAKAYLRRNQPAVIAVTGTTNVYDTKQQIVSMLDQGYKVRTSKKNYSAKFGVPASILNVRLGGDSAVKWVKICAQSFVRGFFIKSKIQILILELALKWQTDMNYLLSIVKPDIAVITNVIPSTLVDYKSTDNLASEYLKLANAVPARGLVLLNAHDERLAKRPVSKGTVIYYGIEAGDIQASDVKQTSEGMSFVYQGQKVTLPRFGKYAVLAFLAGSQIKSFFDKYGVKKK
ncbi:MAG: hypothetical protein COT81_00575 [Candidatus Buchananbacteria bacterium CG10_big_fil_rev_8_21_14_0_10_42_9]|uniref:Mur ligase central domain-containing protein n=1 Tax=Candidatus Buchananbacteria bacterium CG10_big_fil_rev_8_21_14_0_10_42_9 TaxID=1974526 RepID=A0A2H0W297_9BACT|nr:MAG: hypothetical protein COT81_00575 [Candidatus Buchananbacteria bacterium CG10_big_fil_rev_8_21_14_0_10_42_9]